MIVAILVLGIIAAIGLGLPIWVAQQALPLAKKVSFRWGAFVAMQTAMVSGGCIATAMLIASRAQVGGGPFGLSVAGAIGLTASIALYLRRRTGILLTIGSHFTFLGLFLVSGLVTSRAALIAAWTTMLVFTAINGVYFGKRWKWLAGDFARIQPKMPAWVGKRRRSRVIMGKRAA